MFKTIKRIATAAAVVLLASGPSAAYARYALDSPAPAVASGQVHAGLPPSTQHTAASSAQGFQWDDAGIGAAGVLALAGVASGAAVARRHRAHHPLTS